MVAIRIKFGDYAGQGSLRSNRLVTVTGDLDERRDDLNRIISDYPAVEAEQRVKEVIANFDYESAIKNIKPFESPVDMKSLMHSIRMKLGSDE